MSGRKDRRPVMLHRVGDPAKRVKRIHITPNGVELELKDQTVTVSQGTYHRMAKRGGGLVHGKMAFLSGLR